MLVRAGRQQSRPGESIGRVAERIDQGIRRLYLGAPVAVVCPRGLLLLLLSLIEQRHRLGDLPDADVLPDDAPARATGTGVVAPSPLSCLPAHRVVILHVWLTAHLISHTLHSSAGVGCWL